MKRERDSFVFVCNVCMLRNTTNQMLVQYGSAQVQERERAFGSSNVITSRLEIILGSWLLRRWLWL